MKWLTRYERFWSAQLDRLAAFVEEEPCPPPRHHQAQPHPQAPAQRAAGESLRRLDRPAADNALVRAGAGAKSLRAEADVRVGGRYRIVVRTPDGEEHDVSGVYREVVPNEKLVFTWAWRSTPERESLVTIALKARRRAERC